MPWRGQQERWAVCHDRGWQCSFVYQIRLPFYGQAFQFLVWETTIERDQNFLVRGFAPPTTNGHFAPNTPNPHQVRVRQSAPWLEAHTNILWQKRLLWFRL